MKSNFAIYVNFAGGVWNGLLIILTTPLYLSKLGFEGFAFFAFWQLLLLITAIFDFGLGASCLREFSKLKSKDAPVESYKYLLIPFERVYFYIAFVLFGVIALGSSWIAGDWLNLQSISVVEASKAIKLMACSVAFQFITTLYTNGLSGLQNHFEMNSCQILGGSLKYLGGGFVISFESSIELLFFYQIFASFFICWITRWRLYRCLRLPFSFNLVNVPVVEVLRKSFNYSVGMFFTAALGLLLANVDRIILSKIVSASDLGKYSIAVTGVGLLQVVILAFYRTYFPKYAELYSLGDNNNLKKIYYKSCGLVGALIVPAGVVSSFFANELFYIWMGTSDATVVLIFRILIIGTTCSGLMWLPAGMQQASGWTGLHVALMTFALALGIPLLVISVNYFGVVGATTIAALHGAIEISLGLILMNRKIFVGENLFWYKRVLVKPLLISIPLTIASKYFLIGELQRTGKAIWILSTAIIVASATLLFCIKKMKGFEDA